MVECPSRMKLNSAKIRQEFPILASGDIIYLDAAATAQTPSCVLDAMDAFYREEKANVHRGMHALSERATIAYEAARKRTADFINAKAHEIVFTKNCTEAINLIARSWGEAHLKQGDTVVLSILEHHSNIVPWLQLKEKLGITVEWIDCDDTGTLQLEELDALLASGSVKLVSVTGLSNVLGVRPDLKTIIKKSHDAGAKVLVDAAQLAAHHPINVRDFDCDFLTCSGHKLYGPTGIGVLYAKRELLEQMPPFLGGGTMIGTVKRDHFTSADIPQKFEAGTPPIAEAVGLTAALNWMSQFAWSDIEQHEKILLKTAVASLASLEGVQILGKPESACVSFTYDGIHPHDLTHILGNPKHPGEVPSRSTKEPAPTICLRAGHHCAEPLHERLGVTASARISVGIYSTIEEIETMKGQIESIREHLVLQSAQAVE